MTISSLLTSFPIFQNTSTCLICFCCNLSHLCYIIPNAPFFLPNVWILSFCYYPPAYVHCRFIYFHVIFYTLVSQSAITMFFPQLSLLFFSLNSLVLFSHSLFWYSTFVSFSLKIFSFQYWFLSLANMLTHSFHFSQNSNEFIPFQIYPANICTCAIYCQYLLYFHIHPFVFWKGKCQCFPWSSARWMRVVP